MANQQAFISLDSCITDYLDEAELSMHKYSKCFNAAFRAMDDLGIDFFYQIRTVVIPINANFTANIPSNCVKLVKVGVLNQAGEVISLNINNNLTSYADLFPNRIAQIQSLAPADSLVDLNLNTNAFNNFWSDNTFSTLYGLPSGAPFIGSYKIDEAAGIIVLDPSFAYEYLVLECVVSPQEGQEYYVPIQFREAIIAWISWKDIKSMPMTRKSATVEKRDRRHDYYNERRLAIARYKPFRPEEMHQLSIQNTRLTVKI